MAPYLRTYSKKSNSTLTKSFDVVNALFAQNLCKRNQSKVRKKKIQETLKKLPSPDNLHSIVDTSKSLIVRKDDPFDDLLKGEVYNPVVFKTYSKTQDKTNDSTKLSPPTPPILPTPKLYKRKHRTIKPKIVVDKTIDQSISLSLEVEVEAKKKSLDTLALSKSDIGEHSKVFQPVLTRSLYENLKTNKVIMSSTPMVTLKTRKFINETLSPIPSKVMFDQSMKQIEEWSYKPPDILTKKVGLSKARRKVKLDLSKADVNKVSVIKSSDKLNCLKNKCKELVVKITALPDKLVYERLEKQNRDNNINKEVVDTSEFSNSNINHGENGKDVINNIDGSNLDDLSLIKNNNTVNLRGDHVFENVSTKERSVEVKNIKVPSCTKENVETSEIKSREDANETDNLDKDALVDNGGKLRHSNILTRNKLRRLKNNSFMTSFYITAEETPVKPSRRNTKKKTVSQGNNESVSRSNDESNIVDSSNSKILNSESKSQGCLDINNVSLPVLSSQNSAEIVQSKPEQTSIDSFAKETKVSITIPDESQISYNVNNVTNQSIKSNIEETFNDQSFQDKSKEMKPRQIMTRRKARLWESNKEKMNQNENSVQDLSCIMNIMESLEEFSKSNIINDSSQMISDDRENKNCIINDKKIKKLLKSQDESVVYKKSMSLFDGTSLTIPDDSRLTDESLENLTSNNDNNQSDNSVINSTMNEERKRKRTKLLFSTYKRRKRSKVVKNESDSDIFRMCSYSKISSNESKDQSTYSIPDESRNVNKANLTDNSISHLNNLEETVPDISKSNLPSQTDSNICDGSHHETHSKHSHQTNIISETINDISKIDAIYCDHSYVAKIHFETSNGVSEINVAHPVHLIGSNIPAETSNDVFDINETHSEPSQISNITVETSNDVSEIHKTHPEHSDISNITSEINAEHPEHLLASNITAETSNDVSKLNETHPEPSHILNITAETSNDVSEINETHPEHSHRTNITSERISDVSAINVTHPEPSHKPNITSETINDVSERNETKDEVTSISSDNSEDFIKSIDDSVSFTEELDLRVEDCNNVLIDIFDSAIEESRFDIKFHQNSVGELLGWKGKKRLTLCNNSSDSEKDDVVEELFAFPKRVLIKPGKFYRRSMAIIKRETMDSRPVPDTCGASCTCPKCKQKVVEASLFRQSVRLVPEPSAPPRDKRVTKSKSKSRKGYVPDSLPDSNNAIDKFIEDISVRSRQTANHLERFSLKDTQVFTARDVVLRRCGQTEPIPFSECYPNTVLKNCHKIGEGVYGEVFLFRNKTGSTSVMKVIPIEGDQIVNGERQKKFEEIISEVIIALELSNLRNNTKNATTGFNEVHSVHCVKGKYPERLLELWDLYDEDKGSENDCPEIFTVDQLYIVLELANGGKDLESFAFNNAQQAYSLFQQTAFSLAVAESSLQFEHRDLHWGNILISNTDKNSKQTYNLNGRQFDIVTHGVEVSIIDFTLSRITADGVCVYNDLGQDPDLFNAEGDYQFEIYRLMQKCNGNDWQHFEPHTNILWLHYTLDKMITSLRYKYTKTKCHANYIQKLKELKDIILEYKSVEEFVTVNFV